MVMPNAMQSAMACSRRASSSKFARRGVLATAAAYAGSTTDNNGKPFSYPELRARIAAILRRMVPREPRPAVAAGPIRIDVHRRRVTVSGKETAPLSAVEFQLLCALARDPSRVYTRAELLRDVWDHRGGWSTRTVDSHAHRLRRKLCAMGDHKLVINVWGVGYRLMDS